MEYSKRDLKYLKLISDIKWHKGFRCKKLVNSKKCNSDKYYAGKKPYSRRCKKCGHLETATAFTVFHNLRMPISTAVNIIVGLYQHYKKYQKNYDDETLGIYKNKKMFERLSLRDSSKKNNITPKAIGVFLKKVGTWFPKTEHGFEDWIRHLKSDHSRNYYTAIKENLFPRRFEKLNMVEMLYRLTLKKRYWADNKYEDRLSDYLEETGQY